MLMECPQDAKEIRNKTGPHSLPEIAFVALAVPEIFCVTRMHNDRRILITVKKTCILILHEN